MKFWQDYCNQLATGYALYSPKPSIEGNCGYPIEKHYVIYDLYLVQHNVQLYMHDMLWNCNVKTHDCCDNIAIQLRLDSQSYCPIYSKAALPVAL